MNTGRTDRGASPAGVRTPIPALFLPQVKMRIGSRGVKKTCDLCQECRNGLPTYEESDSRGPEKQSQQAAAQLLK